MLKTYQFNINGILLNEYESVVDAAKSINGTAKALGAACNGRAHGTHKYMGYLWSHDKTIEIK